MFQCISFDFIIIIIIIWIVYVVAKNGRYRMDVLSRMKIAIINETNQMKQTSICNNVALAYAFDEFHQMENDRISASQVNERRGDRDEERDAKRDIRKTILITE